MKYFLLNLDPVWKVPRILNGFEEINRRDINLKKWRTIQNRVLFFVDAGGESVLTGVLNNPFFLLSEDVYKITQKYDPLLRSRQIVLLDKDIGLSCLYYLPILPRVDCISKKSVLNNGRNKFIGTPVLNINEIGNKHIFWLAGFNSDLPVISLDLAESILRRDTMGIGLTPVELE